MLQKQARRLLSPLHYISGCGGVVATLWPYAPRHGQLGWRWRLRHTSLMYCHGELSSRHGGYCLLVVSDTLVMVCRMVNTRDGDDGR